MLAIIDGDVLAYQACQNRYVRDQEFVRISLDEDGNKIPPTFTAEEDAEYLQSCWAKFQRDLESLVNKLYCTDYIMAVKGTQCFRYDIYPEYKMTRKSNPTGTNFVPVLRELAVYEELAIPAIGREADDLLRIWAGEAKRAGHEYVICSIDKDLRCIPGKHYIMHYEKDKQKLITISEDEAQRHYYEQLLKGDPTDNIPGVPRVGEVKAKKLIAECTTENEMQEAVVSAYIGAYGDDWYSHFLINAKLIHIQTHINEYFDCRHWPIIKELCG